MPRPLLFACLILLALLPSVGAESREASIDVIILLDKSLSMAESIEKAKDHVAGELIGAVILPGDRLVIELFYGKIERLYGGRIRTEADKAAAIASLRGVRGDGRFTDIGAALDRARADLEELGSPERPKWVLLVTDERQEAPWGTPYYSADFTLRHPALEFVKKADMGGFRVITVGFGVGPRIDAAAPAVMKLLAEPPPRSVEEFPELPAGSDGSLSSVGGSGAGGSEASGKRAAGMKGGESPQPGSEGANGKSAREGGSGLSLPSLGLAALGVLALAGGLALALVLRKRTREKGETA